MTFVFKNFFASLANDETDDKSEVSSTSVPTSKPSADCPDALLVKKKKKKAKKKKKNKKKGSTTLNLGTLHHADKVDVLETTNSAGPSVQVHYLLNDGKRPRYPTAAEFQRATKGPQNRFFQPGLDSPETLDDPNNAELSMNSLNTSIKQSDSPPPTGNLLDEHTSTPELHKRLRNPQLRRPQQMEDTPQTRRLNSLLRALDRADEDTFWMGSRNERSNVGTRPPSPPPYDQPSMTFVSHESGNQDIYVGHGCTVNAGQSTTVFAHSGCIVFAGYGSTIINDGATTPSDAESASTISPSETVRIKYGLEWADQEGSKEVRRHMPIQDLKSMPESQEIKNNFAPTGIVNVSPAKLANSETRVAVKSSYGELMQGIRDEWRVERERVIDEALKKLRREEDQLYLEERRVTASLICRNFEDFVFARFAHALGVEVKDQSHGRLISLFQAQFRVEEFTDEDYDHLRTSSKRKDANNVAHLYVNTTETRIFRDMCYDYFRRYGDPSELERVQKYYKFAVGEYGLARR